MNKPKRARYLPLAALFLAAQVFAHGNQISDMAAQLPSESDPSVTLSGYIAELVIENRVAGTVTRYPVLVTDDGQRLVLKDPAAAGLVTGSGATVSGRLRNQSIFVSSAQTDVVSDNRYYAARRPSREYSGTLELAHFDNFDGGPSGYIYSVVGTNDETVNLLLGTALPELVRGSVVTVIGQAEPDQSVFADRIVIIAPPMPGAKSRIGPKFGPFTNQVLVIPVKFPTNTVPPYTYNADPFTIASIDNAVFTGSGSAANFYKEGSFNQQMLAGIVGHDGANAFLKSTSPPPTPIGCNYLWIETQAKAAAQSRGYNTASYQNLVYVFPSTGFNCGWAGLAYVGLGRAWVKNTTSVLVFGHELGHNFGLYHAGSIDCGVNVLGGTCTVSDYGDPFGIMGNARAMHFSSEQKAYLQWIPPSTVKTHAAGTVSYTLTPLETAGGLSYAVKVPVASNRIYWIEYRQPIGFDAALASFPNNGAQIRVASPFEYTCGSCANDTQYLDMTPATGAFTDGTLVVGQSYFDAVYGMQVDIVSAAPTALQINVTTPGPTPASTTTTIASLSNPAPAGNSVLFTATVSGIVPTGNVAFMDGIATITGCASVALTGTGNTRTANCSTSALIAGAHTIVANYLGDSNNLTSASPPYGQSISTGSWLGFLYGMSFATGNNSGVAAGSNNRGNGSGSFVGAGQYNLANSTSALVIGGFDNRAVAIDSLVGAGAGNRATGARTVIVGGGYNLGSGSFAFIGGGGRDGVVSTAAGTTILDHIAAAKWATIGGGVGNRAGNSPAQTGATVAGGDKNQALNTNATVGGGTLNLANALASTIAGGQSNSTGASATAASVGGGQSNSATGIAAVVPGGDSNLASGNYSFAAGRRAKTQTSGAVIHNGAFVFADGSNFDFHSAASNEFAVRASGGARIVSAIDGAGLPTAGVSLAAGSGTWASLSDRAAKQDLTAVDAQAVLTKVAALPLYTWRYRSETSGALHLGPTAQDFRASFGLGDSDTTITTVDADGVALTAVQALRARLHAKEAQIARQAQRLAALRQRIASLEATQSELVLLKDLVAELLRDAGNATPAAQVSGP